MHHESELLLRYVRDGSEEAFEQLVQRHLKLVFGAAMRRTDGNRELSLDVSQNVFASLARNAASLSRHPALAAWLYTATRNEALKSVVSEHRRRSRESTVAAISASEPQEPMIDWQTIRPVLDDAMDQLVPAEREAVLLRFFDERSFSEVGTVLRISEEAARKRVERGLEKLRSLFARRGMTCTAAALAELLANQPAFAGHAALASSISSSALAYAASGTGSAISAGGFALVSPAKVTIATLGIVFVLGTLNVTASKQRTALASEFSARRAQQKAALSRGLFENRNLHETLEAVLSPPPLVTDDSVRMAEMADLIQSGLVGITAWPVAQPSFGQSTNLVASAESLAQVIGLSPAQLAALQNILKTGTDRFRAAVAGGTAIDQHENEAVMSVSSEALAGSRAAYDEMLLGIPMAIGPEKTDLLKKCGFLSAVHTVLGHLGVNATTVTITKEDQIINGRLVGGYSYNGKYSGTADTLIDPARSNGTFRTNSRSGIFQILGSAAYRLPESF